MENSFFSQGWGWMLLLLLFPFPNFQMTLVKSEQFTSASSKRAGTNIPQNNTSLGFTHKVTYQYYVASKHLYRVFLKRLVYPQLP